MNDYEVKWIVWYVRDTTIATPLGAYLHHGKPARVAELSCLGEIIYRSVYMKIIIVITIIII